MKRRKRWRKKRWNEGILKLDSRKKMKKSEGWYPHGRRWIQIILVSILSWTLKWKGEICLEWSSFSIQAGYDKNFRFESHEGRCFSLSSAFRLFQGSIVTIRPVNLRNSQNVDEREKNCEKIRIGKSHKGWADDGKPVGLSNSLSDFSFLSVINGLNTFLTKWIISKTQINSDWNV
jgi:hypothetical protein